MLASAGDGQETLNLRVLSRNVADDALSWVHTDREVLLWNFRPDGLDKPAVTMDGHRVSCLNRTGITSLNDYSRQTYSAWISQRGIGISTRKLFILCICIYMR